MSFYSNNFFEVQIENSSICNARCPQCVREIIPNDKSWLKETYLETDFFDRIPDEVYQQTKIFFFCGNIGDPCAAPNFLDVCRLIRKKNPNLTIKISTNGGLRSTKFWQELASIVGDKSEVIFAIDGLEDTNHIYRVNVEWKKVLENVKAFIDAGGKPYWQYITFKHNQHQVEEARELSKKLGFQKFIVKPSHRFALDEIMGIDRRGNNDILIEPPDHTELLHKVMFQRKSTTLSSMMEDSNASEINCYVLNDQSVYIDSEGRLFPCCFLSASVYVRNAIKIKDRWDEIWNEYGDEKINLKNFSWKDIIEGEFFMKIKNSWKETYETGRLFVCATTCSKFSNRLNDPTEFNKIIEDVEQ